MCLSVNDSIEKHWHILGHTWSDIVHILQYMSLDKSLYLWLVWTLQLNDVASNVFSRMMSDLSSDMRPKNNEYVLGM